MENQVLPQKKQIQISADNQVLKGSYANAMQVAHTKEEFFLDFMLISQGTGQFVSRLITSPGHLKRIIKALEKNLQKYESGFGQIETSEEPSGQIGFGRS